MNTDIRLVDESLADWMARDPVREDESPIFFTYIYMLNVNGYIEFSVTYMEVKEINMFKKNTRMNK